jgi:hypothetical protein
MFGSRSRGRLLPDICADLSDAIIRLDGPASSEFHRAAVERAHAAVPDELSDALVRLLPAVREVALGNGAHLARLVAGLIELGAAPEPVLDVLVDRIATGLEQAARFQVLAARMDVKVTAPESPEQMAALRDRLVRAAAETGIPSDDAMRLTQAWLTVDAWIPALLLPLQQRRGRRALPSRGRLIAATEAVLDDVESAGWLHGLLLVLDDEPVLVLHRATGRAYAVTIGGIGDNFQLHTLLAATLIGDPARGLLPGVPPRPEWVAAARDGEWAPEGGIEGQFNLVDGYGAWIWNEGRPSDIPLLGDRRVIVLDPPPYRRGWDHGRLYPLMRPELTLTRVVGAAEAAGWLSRVAPAKEMGR